MKLAIDGMGGDNAPQSIVEGVLQALEDFNDIEILLYGREEAMKPYLKEHPRLTVIHCEEVVEGEDDQHKLFVEKKIHR